MNKRFSKLLGMFFAVFVACSMITFSAQAAKTPAISKTAVSVLFGKTYTLKVSNYTKTIKWSSSDKNIATVSSKGEVKGITTGSAVITAKAGSKTLTCKVTVIGYKVPSDAVKYGGHYYKVYETKCAWTTAKTNCEKAGGHLATITSQGEQDFIAGIRNYRYLWIGGTDKDKEGTWKWVTGEKFSYTNWDGNQPDDYNRVEDYLCIWSYNKWNDYDNNQSAVKGYICEWEGNFSKTGLDKASTSVYYGATTTLNMRCSAAPVTWKSSNTAVATVSSKGVVTGKAVGSAVITATTAGKSYKCTVKVIDKNVSASASIKCTTGGTFIKGINSATVSFKLSDNAYKATVDIVDATGKSVYKKTYAKLTKNVANTFTWTGKTTTGTYVSAGSYRVQVTVGSKKSYSSYLPFKTKSDFAGGDGSKSNPYLIASITQFKKVVKYPSGCFKQINNLDVDYNEVGGWFTESQKFNGIYDGNNKKISNIASHLPLFNYVGEKGILKNLIMENCVVTSTEESSAVLVRYNYGIIQDCNIDASFSITRDLYAYGGIVTCNNYGKIVNCIVTGEASVSCKEIWWDHAVCAPIAQHNHDSGKVISCTTNCRVTGISGNDEYVSGIVGINEGLIADCEAQGTAVGSRAGAVVSRNTGSIQRCYYTGSQQIKLVEDNQGAIR